MSLITVQSLTTAGLVETFVDANATGDTFVNDGHTLLFVKSSVTSTNALKVASQFDPIPKGTGTALSDTPIGANAEVMAGFYSQDGYNDSDNIAHISYTTDTTLNSGMVHWASANWVSGTQWYPGESGLKIAAISVT